MRPVTWIDRLRYKFDNYMSRGTIALIGGLALLSLVIILLAGTILYFGQVAEGDSTEGITFLDAVWQSLMRTLDAGTMGGDTGWRYRLIMFAVTLGGVFIISSLIGVLTSGLESKLEELRKGRSRVVESNHTIILGWSSQIFSIIGELVAANANQPNPCIVILGGKDKVEMEDEIRANVGSTGRTRVVCRTGSPMDLNDLELVSVGTCRSIIVLSTANANPDADVIKSILAITNSPNRRPEPYHIVAEIRDLKNLDAARMVGRDEVELIAVGHLISRIIAQTCRQSGLSVVYTELLDFEGDEIYFKYEPGIVGKTYGEALLAYEDSTVLGIQFQDGRTHVNPAMDTALQDGDKIIAISEDDDTIRLSGKADLAIDESVIQTGVSTAAYPERTLVLGWNWRAPSILAELDHYVTPGSTVTVVANLPEQQVSIDYSDIINQSIAYISGDTTSRQVLNQLNIPSFNHIIVLSYSDTMEIQQADACTLMTLLHLRDMADAGNFHFTIVSEMLDIRNRELAEVTRADDFIVSDRLLSLMLSQISENKYLNAVFEDIFDPEGSEIYLKPAENYVSLERPVNFYTVVEAARRRGETALGYRLYAQRQDASQAYGVVVNPDKSQWLSFARGDKVIVLAEE